MDDFYRTNMGHRFFEGTMPALVSEIKTLNANLERLLKVLEDGKEEGSATIYARIPKEPT